MVQALGRLMYVFDSATEQWVEWTGTSSGSGGVVIYTVDGVAITTPFAGNTITSGAGLPTLGVAAINYGSSPADNGFLAQRNLEDDVDAEVPIGSATLAGVISRLQAFNGTNYDRLRSFAVNADNVTPATLGVLGSAAFMLAFDGTNFDRVRSAGDNADGVTPATAGDVLNVSRATAFNGTNWDRARTNSAATLSSSTQPFAQLVSQPGEWSINHTPAANTQATITRAAGAAGVRHVCKSITATLIGLTSAAETTVLVNLRDGATGAGTILWSTRLLVQASGEVGIALSGLNIVGSAATAMTLEFAAAGGADTFESVAITGYDTI